MSNPNFSGLSQLPPEQADARRGVETGRKISEAVPDWLKSGRMVTATLTDADEQKVTHGLGRTPRGWFAGSFGGDADRTAVIQTAADASTLTLLNRGATGTLAIQLWVF